MKPGDRVRRKEDPRGRTGVILPLAFDARLGTLTVDWRYAIENVWHDDLELADAREEPEEEVSDGE